MNKSNLILSIIVAVLGLVVLVIPETFIKIAVILMGAATIIEGLNSLIKVRPLLEDKAFRRLTLIRGLASILIGLLAVCLPLVFFNTVQGVIRVMLYVLAVYLIVSAVAELFLVAQLNQNGISSRNHKIQAIWFFIAVMLFLLPANFGVIIVRILGAVLIVCGIGYALYCWHNRTTEVQPENLRDADSLEQND